MGKFNLWGMLKRGEVVNRGAVFTEDESVNDDDEIVFAGSERRSKTLNTERTGGALEAFFSEMNAIHDEDVDDISTDTGSANKDSVSTDTGSADKDSVSTDTGSADKATEGYTGSTSIEDKADEGVFDVAHTQESETEAKSESNEDISDVAHTSESKTEAKSESNEGVSDVAHTPESETEAESDDEVYELNADNTIVFESNPDTDNTDDSESKHDTTDGYKPETDTTDGSKTETANTDSSESETDDMLGSLELDTSPDETNIQEIYDIYSSGFDDAEDIDDDTMEQIESDCKQESDSKQETDLIQNGVDTMSTDDDFIKDDDNDGIKNNESVQKDIQKDYKVNPENHISDDNMTLKEKFSSLDIEDRLIFITKLFKEFEELSEYLVSYNDSIGQKIDDLNAMIKSLYIKIDTCELDEARDLVEKIQKNRQHTKDLVALKNYLDSLSEN